MTYATVCSGIEAPSAGWHGLGWEPLWFSEIEPFPCSVLAHKFPNVPNLGDMTQLLLNSKAHERPIDLFCGGTPCQSFSVAGLRKGLDDPRGNLALVFLGIVDALRPRWVVWENVPGVLSSGCGRDFGAFLGALGQLGYGWAYRTLDAQYWGVAQRRKRVFLVAHLGTAAPANAVLFERQGLQGYFAKGGGKRKSVAAAPASGPGEYRKGLNPAIVPTVTAKWGKGSGGRSGDECQNLIADLAPTLNARFAKSLGQDNQHIFGGMGHFVVDNPDVPMSFRHSASTADNGTVQFDLTASLRAGDSSGQSVAYNIASVGHEITPTLDRSGLVGVGIRRITPTECERLQGFPDGWTDVPHKGKPAHDGPRYRALGNSMAVPVVRWIGERIQMVDDILYSK